MAEGFLPFWDGSGGLNDFAWTACWLGGAYLPGLTTVECERARRIEKKPVKGKDGTKVTDQGDELAPVKIRTEIYTRDQWEEWQALIPALFPKKAGGERLPMEIIHPSANLLGITDIYLEKLRPSGPENQVLIIEIDAFEYQPNPVELTTSAGRGNPVVQQTQQDVARQQQAEQIADGQASAANAARQLGRIIGGEGWLF